MKELIKLIDITAQAELNMANEKWPQFHSKHEAIGVIAEEVFEMKEEMRPFEEAWEGLIVAAFRDFDCERPLKDAERRIQAALAEGVQVLAMLKKFKCFLDKEGK